MFVPSMYANITNMTTLLDISEIFCNMRPNISMTLQGNRIIRSHIVEESIFPCIIPWKGISLLPQYYSFDYLNPVLTQIFILCKTPKYDIVASSDTPTHMHATISNI